MPNPLSRRKHHAAVPLMIRELAVDPADVDRHNYPVTIRLSRSMTEHETAALAATESGLEAQGDAIVVSDARIDDIAHAHAEWTARLESIEALGEELAGEDLMAEQRRADNIRANGSHLGERHDPYSMH